MIRYYTNRELSKILNVNLARWKRWSRSFLRPDPLGGRQSGYARQYAYRDLFKVYLGGHLLSHQKLSVPESRQVLADLSPWLNKNGFFDWNGPSTAENQKEGQPNNYRIYFSPLQTAPGASNGSGFRYLIRKSVDLRADTSMTDRQFIETFEETILYSDLPDGSVFLQHPDIHLINITALSSLLAVKLEPQGH
jgi:hypothetical protein